MNSTINASDGFKRKFVFIIGLLLLFTFIFSAPIHAFADNGLTLATPYPGITVKAGDIITFDMTIVNTTPEPLDPALSIISIPDGWAGFFEGDGSEISRVHAPSMAEDPTKLTFNLTIPENAKDGTYNVSLLADAGNGISDVLDLQLNVSQLQHTQGKFTSQFPALQGSADTVFNFSVNLSNNSSAPKSYGLTAKAPEGWKVAFRPADETTQVASITVDGGKNKNMDISITPPANAAAGEYTINCAATSADEALTVDLTVDITGSYDLSLTTPSGLLSVDGYAGRETPVTLVATNTGSADIENLTFSSTLPANWSVRYEPNALDSLPAGTSKQIMAYITPGPNAIAGDYVAKLTADGGQTEGAVELRVAVKTHTSWGIVGIAILAALVVLLVFIFRKFGRR